MHAMTIGETAARSGVSAKMIRHDETIDLIAAPATARHAGAAAPSVSMGNAGRAA